MRVTADANKYLSNQAPWKLRESDPERMRTICHVALQLVDDAKTLLTPFLPRSSQQVYEMLGGQGEWSGMPRIDEVDEDGGPSYRSSPVTTTWRPRGNTSRSSRARRCGPRPAVRQAAPSVVEEELRRLEGE